MYCLIIWFYDFKMARHDIRGYWYDNQGLVHHMDDNTFDDSYWLLVYGPK